MKRIVPTTATAQSKTSAVRAATRPSPIAVLWTSRIAVLTCGSARLPFDSGESEFLARLVKNEGQPSSEEQHDQNHRDAELVFEVSRRGQD